MKPIASRARLAIEITAAYLRARHTIRRLPLPAALAHLRRAPARRPPVGADEGRHLAQATRRVLRLIPSDTRCLMQSLTLSTLLARRGTEGVVVIGVNPGESFGAHAWVELDGMALLPPGGDTYQRLVEL